MASSNKASLELERPSFSASKRRDLLFRVLCMALVQHEADLWHLRAYTTLSYWIPSCDPAVWEQNDTEINVS